MALLDSYSSDGQMEYVMECQQYTFIALEKFILLIKMDLVLEIDT